MSESTRLSELVELPALAAALNLPKSWLRKQAVADKIPVLRIGQKMRFNVSAVETAIEQMAAGGNGSVAAVAAPAPVAASTSPTPPPAAPVAPTPPPAAAAPAAAAPPAEKKPRTRKPKENAAAPAATPAAADAPAAAEIPIGDEPEAPAPEAPKTRKRQSFEEPAPEGLF